jgi:thiamine pyrophosphate-dependent acetolactate synthase large subunit-like protein
MAKKQKSTLDRREALGAILAKRGDALLVTGLGSTCYDAGTLDHPNTFYLWGGMGAAAMVGLGLALAQPKRRVIVATGDGEMLMAMGAFATIGAKAPRNLAIVVMDNELYSETGMQPTHTAHGVDLAGIAKSCGFARSGTVWNLKQLATWVPSLYKTPGPVFLAAKVTPQRYPMSIRYRDGTAIKNRFRENLLGFEKAYY